ncbi:hypothetical protein EDC04DRAFT_2864568 [Pisolithus marmoratus]|nr:hypothetical protein EDC04DRAFT_2864568 [Pisolithus marmoratus]
MDHESSHLLSFHPKKPSPDTLTKLIRRLRALTLRLLPVEVDVKSLKVPGSRIITPQVISAYIDAAGDFYNELPYCLLRAHAGFMWDANHNPADYGENLGRAVACEVLARRIVHQSPPDKIIPMVTTRYRYRHADGDISVASSALEIAIDNSCLRDVPYHKPCNAGFEAHFDPARLSVPRFQNIIKIIVWLVFLVVYSQAGTINFQAYFDVWEYILYIIALAICCEGISTSCSWYQYFRFATYRAVRILGCRLLSVTDSLLLPGERAGLLRLRSFQILSFVAPFIWHPFLTAYCICRYIGTMQICVARMLQESGIFFALLTVLGAGFFQGLYALDVADGESESYSVVVVLLNVLISLFASAYSDVVDDAEAEYLAFFAGKTVAMIRAPDSYVYPAPLNRVVMSTIFFIPLCIIALYEAGHMERSWVTKTKPQMIQQRAILPVEGVDAERGLQISKMKFSQLLKRFPNTEQSSEEAILKEIKELQGKLHLLIERLPAST